MKLYDSMIIGGGAAGLLTAIRAAERGLSVCVIEQMAKIGKKILATGNGRCNMTNLSVKEQDYRGDDPQFAYDVLEKFSVKETLDFFESIGIVWKEENGYVYPRSEQATSVVSALELKLQSLGVDIFCDQKVVSLQKEGDIFICETEQKERFLAYQCVIATGGKAQPKLGSDGKGYELAKQFGHTVTVVVPALTGLHTSHKGIKQWAGVRAKGGISCLVDGAVVMEEEGEIQFTNYGISGVPTFQISRYATKMLQKGRKVEVMINFYREKSFVEFLNLLEKLSNCCDYKNIRELLEGIFSKKLVPIFLQEANIKETLHCKEMTKEQRNRLCFIIQNFKIPIVGFNSFEQCQVCAGGVVTKEICRNTMESLKIKNLYFVGEVVDIDGTCGGYNLQWAWTSGYLAGNSVQKYTRSDRIKEQPNNVLLKAEKQRYETGKPKQFESKKKQAEKTIEKNRGKDKRKTARRKKK